jgi:carboxyl-terminal processing protease
MSFRVLAAFLIFLFSFLEAKPPALTPHDTKIKLDEILKAHVKYQELSPELIRRSLQNFIEELDPSKTYFLESEIDVWMNPTDSLLKTSLDSFNNEEFRVYELIHAEMIKAIDRRNRLEAQIQANCLPKNVQITEFKDIKWASTEQELYTRLCRIKSLQLNAAEKLNQESQQQFQQRLNKRRIKREEEIIAANEQERKQLTLTYILKAVSSALDSQTTYFTPGEANQFLIQVQQRLSGIGAQLRDDLSGFTIVRLLEGGPASADNKLKVGDRIIAVNNEPVVGMEITDAVELIRGPQGSKVQLTILREIQEGNEKQETKLDIEIIRGEIVLKESRLETSYEPFGDGIIVTLHLFSFYQDHTSSSSEDLRKAIKDLQKDHKIKGIILDLRNNAGGLLPQAVTVTGLFIKKGVVVSIKDNTGTVQNLRNLEDKVVWDGPLIVLTNRTSASASEIVAQTLQDYGRALIVGDPETYGKGTFQTFTLEATNFGKVNPKGEFKVTRGCYYTVSGKSPQLKGVQVDIVVPGIFSQLEIGEKFSKFPLDNDQISPHFVDDLSDLPIFHRYQVARLYKNGTQGILTSYQPYLDTLRQNSQKRIEQNQNYQLFIKETSQKELYSEPTEKFGQADLQHVETLNIMKDLITLSEQAFLEPAKAA